MQVPVKTRGLFQALSSGIGHLVFNYLFIYLETGPLTGLEPVRQAGWLANPRYPPVSTPSCTHDTQLQVDFRGHICKASADSAATPS